VFVKIIAASGAASTSLPKKDHDSDDFVAAKRDAAGNLCPSSQLVERRLAELPFGIREYDRAISYNGSVVA
jgi:hypothetical protein